MLPKPFEILYVIPKNLPIAFSNPIALTIRSIGYSRYGLYSHLRTSSYMKNNSNPQKNLGIAGPSLIF